MINPVYLLEMLDVKGLYLESLQYVIMPFQLEKVIVIKEDLAFEKPMSIIMIDGIGQTMVIINFLMKFMIYLTQV
jgi:hypothetical protein